MQYIENRTFDELRIGDSAELIRTLEPEDISLFAVSSGDVNPIHLETDFAETTRFHEIIAHGMWGGALISAVLGTQLPGPGAIYLEQSLSFQRPVGVGDTVRVSVTVTKLEAAQRRVTLDCRCLNQDSEVVITGEATVIAPKDKVRRPRALLPRVQIYKRGQSFNEIFDLTRDLDPIVTAVVHPCNEISLMGALKAQDDGLIAPLLVGPRSKIMAAADAAELDLSNAEIVEAPHSHAAAEKSVELVRAGRVEALMKGALHTDEVMSAVVDRTHGLRTERRVSHVFAIDAPSYPKPLFVTDAAINIAPDVDDKRDIVQNAIDLARAVGVARPKVAILSAVETVSPKIPSTLEAAALCKMADRGQITGGDLDGPLAFDNAISAEAARTKNIASRVAGDADILVAPDLEAGNMIAKQLIYLGGADAAGVVLGARVPIMLTSRADGELARRASAMLAQIFAHRQKAV
ncbi:MAG: bifunctional enoyl-CoA hydratase/phosphate acetyltransferase [Pseudomonadota bacterium]